MEGVKPASPAAVLFDWDGTLVDTLGGIRAAHDHVLTAFGLKPWTDEEFHTNIIWSARDLFPRLYGERAGEAEDMFYAHVSAHHLDYLRALPGARDVLDFLKARRIPAAVVSNKKQPYIMREVDHLGWQGDFFHVIGAGTAPRDKPAADPILWALERAARPLAADAVWFVGDTEADLGAAAAAGCPSVLLTHGEDRSVLRGRYNPLIVAENCSNFLEIIRKIIA